MTANRHRRWCFTDFGLNTDYNGYKYLIYGVELCPETGLTHHQGYAEFSQSTSMASVKRCLGNGVHVELCRGNQETNINYCKKQGNWREFGEKNNQGKRSDLLECCEMVKSGKRGRDIADTFPLQFVVHRRGLAELSALYEPTRDWVTEVIVLWGLTGSGKTRTAMEDGATLITYENGFFAGYDGEDTVLLDDFEGSSQMSRGIFLQMTDRYKYLINVKGGHRNWKPRKLYITSNLDPVNWGYVGYDAIARRLTSVIEKFVE